MTNLIIEKLLAKTKRTDLPDFAPAKLYYLRSLRGKAARLKDVDREHATAATK